MRFVDTSSFYQDLVTYGTLLPEVGLFAKLPGLIRGGMAAARMGRESVPLFRAVEGGELADILRHKAFRNPFGNEVKYFSTTLQGAARETQLLARFAGGPLTIVETSIPRSALRLLPQGNILTVDVSVRTVVLPTEFLPRLTPPRILGP